MHKPYSFAARVTAPLIVITVTTAWSGETAPGGAAAPAERAPTHVYPPVPGWYPPPPPRGRYPQPWQQAPRWPTPPWGYTQVPPRYPPRGQFPPVPAAPPTAEDPLSAELKQTQEQLSAKTADLDKARATLEQLRIKLQHRLEAELDLTEKLAAATGEQQALQARVSELNAELRVITAKLEHHRRQIADRHERTQTLTAERDQLRSALADRDKQLATLQAELRATTRTLQQTKSESATSNQQLSKARKQAETLEKQLSDLQTRLEKHKTARLSAEQALAGERRALADRDKQLATLQVELQTVTDALEQARVGTVSPSPEQLSEARAQAEALNKELTGLKAQLENRSTTLLETAQTLAKVIAERDGLQAQLTARDRELDRVQADLTSAQSEADKLRQAGSAAAELVATEAAGAPDQAKSVEEEERTADTVEIAALQGAAQDTDSDGVADNNDLCPGTKHGVVVEPTGCAAGVPIKLEGVNFGYDSYQLTDEARHILDRVADILSRQTDLRLHVAGHTDAQGDPAYNQWLSLQRAEAVRDYLVAKGVNPAHIGAVGYGGQRPLTDNTTKEGLRMNRRVELHSR